MFGEDYFFGRKTVSVDSKNRIYLPTFTNAEKDDELILIRNENNDEEESYYLYEKSEICNWINHFYKEMKSSEKLPEYNNRRKIYEEFCKSIILSVRCDAAKRICLSDVVKSNKIECIGCGKVLMLKPKYDENK